MISDWNGASGVGPEVTYSNGEIVFGSTKLRIESFFNGNGDRVEFPVNFALGVGDTLRVLKSGNRVSAYINGIFIGQNNFVRGVQSGDYVGIWAYNSSVEFRNFKVWSVSLP